VVDVLDHPPCLAGAYAGRVIRSLAVDSTASRPWTIYAACFCARPQAPSSKTVYGTSQMAVQEHLDPDGHTK
jgi:hypothetical protein